MNQRLLDHLPTGTLAAVALAIAALFALGRPAHAATITVAAGTVAINNADGKCSLIEAISNANDKTTGQPYTNCAAGNPSGADIINLPANSSYVLTSALDPLGPNGLPAIDTTVTIKGTGILITRSSSAPFFRIFDVKAGGNLSLEGISLTNGYVPSGSGGAVRVTSGILTFTKGGLQNNSAYSGGAIYNQGGTINLTQMAIVANSADNGGALGSLGGTLGINNSYFQENKSRNGGDGGAIWSFNSQLTVDSSEFSRNESADQGGAILSADGTTATITRSTFDNNKAATDGGAIYSATNSRLFIDQSSIFANTANRDGGAVYSDASTVAPDVEVMNSTISYNLARDGSGGALYNGTGVFSLINTTLVGNTAGWRGGGVFHNGTSRSLIVRTIVTANNAAAGYEVFGQNEARIGSEYSLFGNSGVTASNAFWNFAPAATDINATNGGGLVSPANDLTSILDPNLKLNGGRTRNHALPFGSIAVDWAPSADCQYAAGTTQGNDQRDFSRNANGSQSIVSSDECDIGAVERQIGERVVSKWWFSILKPGALSLNGAQMDYQSGDVLEYDASEDSWTTRLDASAAGLSRNITGFGLLADGSVLVTFGANQAIPGAGTFTPWDVARLSPSGVWSWYLDGSTAGLTTTAEKIDALTVSPDGRLLISTMGAATVTNAAGQTIRPQDEDLMAFTPKSGGGGSWAIYFDGSTIPGLAVEDVVNASVDPDTGDLLIGMADNFNVAGITGTNRDLIIIGRGHEDTVTVSKAMWNGAYAGLNGVPDALEVR